MQTLSSCEFAKRTRERLGVASCRSLRPEGGIHGTLGTAQKTGSSFEFRETKLGKILTQPNIKHEQDTIVMLMLYARKDGF